MNTIELCVGCMSMKLTLDSYFCLFEYHGMQNRCPCVNCLVKVMCDHSCGKYNDEAQMIRDKLYVSKQKKYAVKLL